jgi:hypothetical protein
MAAWLPEWLRGSADPHIVWLVALPVWMVMTGTTLTTAPGASYLWIVPLLGASLSLVLLPLRWPALFRLASLDILIVVALFWVRDTWVLHDFLIEQMARSAIVAPAFVYVAVPLVAGLMLAPPIIAALGGPFAAAAKRRCGGILVFASLAFVVGTLVAPSYTFDRPLRGSILQLHDESSGISVWELGSVEPWRELDPTAADAPDGWEPVDSPLMPWLFPRGLRRPFNYRAPAAPRPFPGDVQVRVMPAETTATVELTVVAPEGSTVIFAVPSSVGVARPTLAGVIRRGYWLASYGGLPVGGVSLRFEVSRPDLDRLGDTAVAITRARLGGAPGWQGLPHWLPQERAVWTSSEIFVRRIGTLIDAAAVVPASLR